MTKTSLHAFKAKDTRFVADWLKSKGLHKLCSVFEGIQEPFLSHLPTQMRFLIGGERVMCHGLNLSNSLGRIKLTNSLGKQQLALWTRT